MLSTIFWDSCFSFLTSPLTVSLALLASQFGWTALVLFLSLSSAPVELCLPRLPSGHRHSRPWKRRPQKSPSLSWRMNCCSLNQTPHLERVRVKSEINPPTSYHTTPKQMFKRCYVQFLAVRHSFSKVDKWLKCCWLRTILKWKMKVV